MDSFISQSVGFCFLFQRISINCEILGWALAKSPMSGLAFVDKFIYENVLDGQNRKIFTTQKIFTTTINQIPRVYKIFGKNSYSMKYGRHLCLIWNVFVPRFPPNFCTDFNLHFNAAFNKLKFTVILISLKRISEDICSLKVSSCHKNNDTILKVHGPDFLCEVKFPLKTF